MPSEELRALNWMVIAPIMCIFHIMLLIYHFYQYYKHEILIEKNEQKKSIFYKIMSILTLVSLIIYSSPLIVGYLNHFACIAFVDKLSGICYQSAKCCMYLIFIMRIYYVYNKSQYAFNVIILIISAVLLVIIYSFLSIYSYIAIWNYKYDHFIFNYHIAACQVLMDKYYIFCVLTMDIISAIVSIILFAIPLIKIMNALTEHYATNFKKEGIKYPVIKISLLTMVATISSVLAHIISLITGTNIAFAVDIPTNCICIILMTSYYKKLYGKLCCGLIKCISFCDKGKDIEYNMKDNINCNKRKIVQNKQMDIDDTIHETRTMEMSGYAIKKIEHETEMTQTVV